MKIFVEEQISKGKKPNAAIIMIEKKDAKVLLEVYEAACESNKRKTSWRKQKDIFEAYLAVF